MLREMLDMMLDDVIRKYGHESQPAITFASKCEETEETFTFVVWMYEKLMEG